MSTESDSEPGKSHFRLSALRVLRHRSYRLFWSGQVVSLVGTWMQTTAQGYLVYELTGSAAMLGLVSAAGSLPILLFSLWGGVFADRVDRRRLLIYTQSSLALSALLLGVLVHTHLVRPYHVVVLAALNGLLNVFDMPARQSLVLEMVAKEDVMAAIGLNSTLFNTARILGPAVAGVAIAKVGLEACYYGNALSFVAVLISLWLIRIPQRERFGQQGTPWQDLVAGLNYIRGDTTLLTLFGLVAVNSVFGSPYAMLMPVFAKEVLHVGARGLGILVSATGVGALLAGFILASLRNELDRRRLLGLGAALYSGLLILFGASHSFPLSCLLLAGIGFGMIVHNATANTVVQLVVPDALRGRVISVWSLTLIGFTPIGSYQAGLIAEHWGAPVSVALGGAVCGLTALVVLSWRWSRLRAA